MKVVTLVSLGFLAAACGGNPTGNIYDGLPGPDDGPAAGDSPVPFPDSNNPFCMDPVDDGCGPSEICDNGMDDDCNGAPDDGCLCTSGAVQACANGPPGRRGVGACTDGTQRCEGMEEFQHWGACEGGLGPVAEQCDTQDNDCNGCVDDTTGCSGSLACPGTMPEAAPFTDYPIDGTVFYGGPVTSWHWTVVGGPCDQLLFATAGTTSFTLTGANASTVHFRPTLSGDYTFTLTIVTDTGETLTCTFIVHVRGPGFRVELCWDTTGLSDIDLHVHKPNTTTPWFTTDLTGMSINPDDCYYYNCKAEAFDTTFTCGFGGTDQANWGNAVSPIAECVGTPEGTCWSAIGSCHNPRLDVDNIATAGIPENINVDNPAEGDSFRVMVHYYGGGATAVHPMVNIYCGGNLLGTYGAAPDTVPSFTPSGGFGAGPMWRVVDAVTHVTAGMVTGCDLTPLHPPGMTSGYQVTTNDRTF